MKGEFRLMVSNVRCKGRLGVMTIGMVVVDDIDGFLSLGHDASSDAVTGRPSWRRAVTSLFG